MKKTGYILLALLFIGGTACKNKQELNQEPNVAEAPVINGSDPMNPQDEVLSLTIDPNYRPKETDPYTIDSVSTVGDVLTIIVNYGGGCEDHEFKLISNQNYKKSMPPQLPLYLEHEANDDMCRAMVQQKLIFDISKAKYTGSKVVRLLINGTREHEAIYEYTSP